MYSTALQSMNDSSLCRGAHNYEEAGKHFEWIRQKEPQKLEVAILHHWRHNRKESGLTSTVVCFNRLLCEGSVAKMSINFPSQRHVSFLLTGLINLFYFYPLWTHMVSILVCPGESNEHSQHELIASRYFAAGVSKPSPWGPQSSRVFWQVEAQVKELSSF